jgi:hypothetical protein
MPINFSDRTVLQLATAAGRNALFDQDTLGNLIATAFDTELAPVDGPFALDVERSDIGVELSRTVRLEGHYAAAPGAVPGDIRLHIDNLRIGSPLRVDLLWRAQLVARHVQQDDRVASVTGGFTALDLDREIVAALGALPVGAALEAARRTRLLARLKANAAQADAIDDAALDAMLAAADAADVASLLAQRGNAGVGRFRLTFSAPQQGAVAVPIRLPVTIAVQAFDSFSGLAALLADSRSIRAALAEDPAVQPPSAPLRRRVPIPLVWIVPATLFDDATWPGANRDARIAATIDLLSSQGIALATA